MVSTCCSWTTPRLSKNKHNGYQLEFWVKIINLSPFILSSIAVVGHYYNNPKHGNFFRYLFWWCPLVFPPRIGTCMPLNTDTHQPLKAPQDRQKCHQDLLLSSTKTSVLAPRFSIACPSRKALKDSVPSASASKKCKLQFMSCAWESCHALLCELQRHSQWPWNLKSYHDTVCEMKHECNYLLQTNAFRTNLHSCSISMNHRRDFHEHCKLQMWPQYCTCTAPQMTKIVTGIAILFPHWATKSMRHDCIHKVGTWLAITMNSMMMQKVIVIDYKSLRSDCEKNRLLVMMTAIPKWMQTIMILAKDLAKNTNLSSKVINNPLLCFQSFKARMPLMSKECTQH